MHLKEVTTEEEYRVAANLFRAYANAIGINLDFQGFEAELAHINTHYAPPKGAIFLAYEQHQPLGCFAVRPFEGSICELKRMYVKPEAQGKGWGKQMMTKAIEVGRALGYATMRLDTLPTMAPAIALYKSAGFYEIAPYRFNPIEGTKYFELALGG